MYGVPDAYGAASVTQTVRSGINAYLEGYDPTEKLRFRNEDLKFFDFDKEMDSSILNAHLADAKEYKYPQMTKTLGTFKNIALFTRINNGYVTSSDATFIPNSIT